MRKGRNLFFNGIEGLKPMAFPEELLDRIRSLVAVSDVVRQRVKLQKRGREWVGLSPFTQEKTPSFAVNDQKGFFHDFSTGAHGDIFDFLVAMEKISYSEAVSRLARQAGITVPSIDRSTEIENSAAVDVRAWLRMRGFEKYLACLPTAVDIGNFLLAEAEARTLRSLFAAEASILQPPFAAKLKTFLEQHMGLRVFYPSVANFYRDVKNGRMMEPLSLDAIEGVLDGVRANTPGVFGPSVEDAIHGGIASPVVASVDTRDLPPLEKFQPVPPADPLGEIDPGQASDFTFAGITNGIWKAFLQGEKIHKALGGWAKTRETLAPHVSEIIGWLHRLIEAGNGPPNPPIISI